MRFYGCNESSDYSWQGMGGEGEEGGTEGRSARATIGLVPLVWSVLGPEEEE